MHDGEVVKLQPGAIQTYKGDAHTWFGMDIDTFLAFVKAHQRAILQQTAKEALGRSGIVRRRVLMPARQRYPR